VGQFSSSDIVLKNYRIEKSIGQGAFGEVYLATHTGLNGKRAIKVLLRDENGVSSSDYQDYRNRFRQESQLMEWFNHPNMIRVYDFQEENKTLFLVMEYAAGGSLQQKIDTAKESGKLFSVDETIRMAVDIAAGLAELHKKDAVHRDLKPSNILIDEHGVLKISDLGLAQIPGGSSMRSQLSTYKPHPGTPVYMSPEQERSGAFLRPNSDVYSMGLMLFEMMTGRNFKMLPPGTTLMKILPEAPGWLDTLLSQMLADNPKDRPWSGEEVLEKLQNGMGGSFAAESPDLSIPSSVSKTEVLPEIIPVDRTPSEPVKSYYSMTGDDDDQKTIPSGKRDPVERKSNNKVIFGIIGALAVFFLLAILIKPGPSPVANTSTPRPTKTTALYSGGSSDDQDSEAPAVKWSTSTPEPTATKDPETCNQVSFVADATIPDGAYVAPGSHFKKTWILKNVGTCTWTKRYALVFSLGDQMGGKSPTYLSYEVKPGQVVDLSLNLTAPSKYGNFNSYWLMQDDEGHLFGWGKNHDQRIWAKITTDK
jgi:serine/threonine protein kinase